MAQDTNGQKNSQRAFGRFTVAVTVAFVILLGRLWYLQAIQGPQLMQKSEANRIGTYRLPALRGMILDRGGQLLVDNRPSFNLVFNSALLPEKDRAPFLLTLSQTIQCDIELAESRLKKRPGPITLKEDITRDEVARVEAMRMLFEGKEFPLRVEQVGKRTFKHARLFSHVIGYTGEVDQERLDLPEYAGYRPGDRVGRSGIEMAYEQYLRGEFGMRKVEENARGMQIQTLDNIPAVPGRNLALNIDLEMQAAAANAMGDQAGSVVALDPRNGRVLVLYSSPPFDPDFFTRPVPTEEWERLTNDPRHPLQNKAIGGVYPPGSTFKVVSALAGLQEKEITLQTPFECRGKWKYGEREFRCFNERGHGAVTFYDSIMRSCDIYYYKLSDQLGIERLAKYARMLGGGRKTGIDIPGESDGLIPDPDWKMRTSGKAWMPGETLNTSIGQGSVMLTPVQLAVIYATIANGGVLYKPQLVGKVLAPDGKVISEFAPVVVGKAAIDAKNFEYLRHALSLVVNSPGGTAYAHRLRSILVAGKTGTAQVRKIGKQRQHYTTLPYDQRDHAWFACFAPVDDPEIVVTAVVEHGGFGGSAAAPIAMAVVAKYAALRKDINSAATTANP